MENMGDVFHGGFDGGAVGDGTFGDGDAICFVECAVVAEGADVKVIEPGVIQDALYEGLSDLTGCAGDKDDIAVF